MKKQATGGKRLQRMLHKINRGGVSPTVMDNHGETVSIADPFVVASRGREPNVLIQTRTEEAKRLRKDYENHRINIQRKYMQQLEPRIDGVSNTLTSVQKDNLLVEPVHIKANTQKGFEEVGESVGSTLTSARPNNVYGDTFPYCIRRLTPRECFRLQDVSEEDIDKIQNYEYPYGKSGKMKHISESQQYKLAGNSIPVACMFYIFKNLFSSPVEKAADAAPVQLDIFDITD